MVEHPMEVARGGRSWPLPTARARRSADSRGRARDIDNARDVAYRPRGEYDARQPNSGPRDVLKRPGPVAPDDERSDAPTNLPSSAVGFLGRVRSFGVTRPRRD